MVALARLDRELDAELGAEPRAPHARGDDELARSRGRRSSSTETRSGRRSGAARAPRRRCGCRRRAPRPRHPRPARSGAGRNAPRRDRRSHPRHPRRASAPRRAGPPPSAPRERCRHARRTTASLRASTNADSRENTFRSPACRYPVSRPAEASSACRSALRTARRRSTSRDRRTRPRGRRRGEPAEPRHDGRARPHVERAVRPRHPAQPVANRRRAGERHHVARADDPGVAGRAAPCKVRGPARAARPTRPRARAPTRSRRRPRPRRSLRHRHRAQIVPSTTTASWRTSLAPTMGASDQSAAVLTASAARLRAVCAGQLTSRRARHTEHRQRPESSPSRA